MTSLFFFSLAALFEIAGCYSFWAWLRLHSSPWWLVPGIVSLAVFALCLTRIDSAYAGRAYAAYGGIYIASSLLWLRGVERISPDRWDLLGAGVSLIGALIVLFGPRPALP